MNPRKQLYRQQQADKRAADLSGTGTYLFANNTKGDYTLPRPTKTGVRTVKRGEQFVGDTYYFFLLKTGDLRLIHEIKEEEVAPVKVEIQTFVFQNRFREELHLPTPSNEGLVFVPGLSRFTGDSRYFGLMREGKIKLIEEVVNMNEKQLITEQPPTITHDGKVEYVVSDEQLTEQKKKDKHISEKTLDGVKLLLD